MTGLRWVSQISSPDKARTSASTRRARWKGTTSWLQPERSHDQGGFQGHEATTTQVSGTTNPGSTRRLEEVSLTFNNEDEAEAEETETSSIPRTLAPRLFCPPPAKPLHEAWSKGSG